MQRYRYDQVLVSPADYELADAVREAGHTFESQGGELNVPWRRFANRIETEQELYVLDTARGRIWRHGGGIETVVSSTVLTQVLGVTWWTSEQGIKLYRVVGDRLPAVVSHNGQRGPCPWGVRGSDRPRPHPLMYCLPGLYLVCPSKTPPGLERVLREQVNSDPLNPFHWQLLADYHEDLAEMNQAQHYRAVGTVVAQLQQNLGDAVLYGVRECLGYLEG